MTDARMRLTGNAALADDVVQETLLRAWRRPEVLDQSETSVRAWLFTVARNLVIDEHRSAHSRNATVDIRSVQSGLVLLESRLAQ